MKWSPTGNGIAFVADYNIYYRPNAEPNTVARQITKDGSEERAIYNGVADWVYEGNESKLCFIWNAVIMNHDCLTSTEQLRE